MKNNEQRFEKIMRTIGSVLAYVLGGIGCYRVAEYLVPIDGLDAIVGIILFCPLCFSVSKIPSVSQACKQEKYQRTCDYLNRLLLNGQYHNPYTGKRMKNTDDLTNYLLEEQHRYYRHLWPPEGMEPEKENYCISPEDMISCD